MSLRLSRSAFEQLVTEALEQLPDLYRNELDNVAIVVEDEPGADELRELDMSPQDELFGLYQGIPLTERDSFYSALPDRIAIFRLPILRACRNRQQVIREVRDTVVHELGHHLGMEEDQMPY